MKTINQFELNGTEVFIHGNDVSKYPYSENAASCKSVRKELDDCINKLDNNIKIHNQTLEEQNQIINDFQDSITNQINSYKPIEITGDVVNAPDEEDLTSTSDNLLQLKDRNNLNGMGYIILRQNKTFIEQLTQTNTIYEIRYDFDLNGEEVTIPENCVLKFDGGSLSNGTVVGNKTKITAGLVRIFNLNITLEGIFNISALCPEWFGAYGNGSTDDISFLQKTINTAIGLDISVELTQTYLVSGTINIDRDYSVSERFHMPFRIYSRNKGGIYMPNIGVLFSSTLPDNKSNAIIFDGVYFEGSFVNGLTEHWVINGNKFIRVHFTGCSFRFCKVAVASTTHIQSLYMSNCYCYAFRGYLIASTIRSYDVHIDSCLIEGGEYGIHLACPTGCSITNSVIEDIENTALLLSDVKGISITGNFFEANLCDIKFESGVNEGVFIGGNFFYNTTTLGKTEEEITQIPQQDTYSIIWGGIHKNSVSIGNYSESNLHFGNYGVNVLMNDIAKGQLSNLETPFKNNIQNKCSDRFIYSNSFTDSDDGILFYDTSLKELIVWINGEWKNLNTGTIGVNKYGPTTKRPESNIEINFQYFDTDLNKPIWWTGTAWVDANGNDIDSTTTDSSTTD